MNITNSLRDPAVIRALGAQLKNLSLSRKITLMEVCGTHTMALHRGGIPSLLPDTVRLLSGPGCPVCVTPASYIDRAQEIGKNYGVTLTSFGDMLRVPGNTKSLSESRSEGINVETVYSPLAALDMARKHPAIEVVFLAVGFETTVPPIAMTVMNARDQGIDNFSILTAHKLIMPALELLVNDSDVRVDGFILPGHVSLILGSEPYRPIAEKYSRACVITGFETADIIQGIIMLAQQIEISQPSVEIQYCRAVKKDGNPQARGVIDTVFEPADSEWRGFGTIPLSGLNLREEFADFDASKKFPVEVNAETVQTGCRCGDVLRGRIEPAECALFGRNCTPEHPVGPCMVSSEGTCAAHYKYSRTR